jgi:type I restriction enzyme R subunit
MIMDKSTEFTFQNDMIKQLVTNGWQLGKPEKYNRELALIPDTY